MVLTGPADGPPALPPSGLVPAATAMGEELSRLTAGGRPVELDALAVLAERAAVAGLTRQGRRSCGGACELLPTADGWLAVSLPRSEDAAMVPAWLRAEGPLPALVELVSRHPVAAVAGAVLLRDTIDRGVEHGLAAESAVYSVLQAGPEFTRWRAGRPLVEVAPTERPVVVERDGDVLTITLDRPGRHNAVDRALRDGLAEALTIAVLDDSVTAVELRGNGPSFCSGGDLDEFGSFPDPATAHASRLTRSPARLAHLLADRLTVHLHGACMGAGIEVPAFAGRVVATADAAIALPELGAGLVPGAGGTVSIPRRIGRHRTALLALSGTRIDGRTALGWGLVDAVEG